MLEQQMPLTLGLIVNLIAEAGGSTQQQAVQQTRAPLPTLLKEAQLVLVLQLQIQQTSVPISISELLSMSHLVYSKSLKMIPSSAIKCQ